MLMLEFPYRSARSGSLIAGIGMVLLVETLALHLWIAARHPLLAWALTTLSLVTLGWLAADYRAMGHGVIRLHEGELELNVGRRFALRMPRENVASAARPTWRDIPGAGTPAAADYLNLMKPADPNVLLLLREPTRVRITGGIRRTVGRIGLHVDEPERLVAEIMAHPCATTHEESLT
jgi:hypothetical protein